MSMLCGSRARLRGKGTSRMTANVLQYSRVVPSHRTALNEFQVIKNFARIKDIIKTTTLIQRYERPDVRRIRLFEEYIYFKKWNYMKYCTEVLKHGLKHNLPLASMDRAKEETSILPALAVQQKLAQNASPLHRITQCLTLQQEVSLSDWVRSKCWRQDEDQSSSRGRCGQLAQPTFFLRQAIEGLPAGSRLCTWRARFSRREVTLLNRLKVWVQDEFGNELVGRALPELFSDDLRKSALSMLPTGSCVIEKEQTSGGIVLTFLLTNGLHEMGQEKEDLQNGHYKALIPAFFPRDDGYSESELLRQWDRYWDGGERDTMFAEDIIEGGLVNKDDETLSDVSGVEMLAKAQVALRPETSTNVEISFTPEWEDKRTVSPAERLFHPQLIKRDNESTREVRKTAEARQTEKVVGEVVGGAVAPQEKPIKPRAVFSRR